MESFVGLFGTAILSEVSVDIRLPFLPIKIFCTIVIDSNPHFYHMEGKPLQLEAAVLQFAVCSTNDGNFKPLKNLPSMVKKKRLA